MYYACPNETVTYTCHDSQVRIIQWIVEPYIPRSDPITFVAAFNEDSDTINRPPALATLTSLNKTCNNVSRCTADINTTLRVNTAEVENKTNITCTTQRRIDFSSNSTYLYIAGWESSLRIYISKITSIIMCTCVLSLQMCLTTRLSKSLTSIKRQIIRLCCN